MTYSEIESNHLTKSLFTLIETTDNRDSEFLVLVDILNKNELSIPVFKELNRYDPMYLYFSDFLRLFGLENCLKFKFYDLNSLLSLSSNNSSAAENDDFYNEWKTLVNSLNDIEL